MCPGPLLLSAAAGLAVVHVTGELFGRPVLRPAELLTALCLLTYALARDLLPSRSRGGPVSWGSSVAAAVLVAGAALTVPATPDAGAGWQILSPEQYTALSWQVQRTGLIPIVAALTFVIVLLTTLRKSPKSRGLIAAGIVVAMLVIGYFGQRVAIVFTVGDESIDGLGMSPSLTIAVAVVPLLLALAALTLAVATATQRRWRAAAGAVLLTVTAVIWIDEMLGALPLPYAPYEAFSPGLITPTDALPHPTQALTAALRLAAFILAVAGLTRRVPAS